MSQVSSNGDLSVANQGFPAFRGDLNEILEAIYTCQSGTSTPANNYANSFFYDQTNNLLKFRNEDNDAYITIMGFDQSADTTTNIVSDATQTFTKAQIPSTETATISTTKTLDFLTYQNFILTLGSGANTLANPTTEASNVGQTGVLIVIQPSSGSAGTISLGTDYETVGGSGLTLSSTNSAYDVVPYIIKADNSILLGTPQLAFS
jgi:hypothetical protein